METFNAELYRTHQQTALRLQVQRYLHDRGITRLDDHALTLLQQEISNFNQQGINANFDPKRLTVLEDGNWTYASS